MTVLVDPNDWCDSEELTDALVIAPPGCGKTELLARRVAACLERRLIPPHRRVLALTFTNKARDNLRSRIVAQSQRDIRDTVTVVNFHGLAYHVYNRHRYVLGELDRELLPDVRELRRIEMDAFDQFDVPKQVRSDVKNAIRVAKEGPYTDDQVRERLELSGWAAASWYEEQLRSESRMDHHDVLRLGLLTLRHPGISALYANRFAYVLIDEAQDLTRAQYALCEQIGEGCTVFAGDLAQGIYGFAGADPKWVFERIEERNPVRVKLHKSYRSAPEVLRVVSALASELGGEELISAEPERWGGRGRARLVVFKDTTDEARWLVDEMRRWLAQRQGEVQPAPVSIAVLTRMNVGGRRDAFVAAAAAAGLPIELWDHPLHRPEVVALLRKHVDGVLATVGEPSEQIEELYLRSFGDVEPEDASTLVDLRDATDELRASIVGTDLRTLVDRIRIGSEIDMPVGHGVHVLTGHAGKGQGFDKVVVLGFEEGQLPIFHVKNQDDGTPEVREELALLHVMASRAKEELVFTYSKVVGRHSQQVCRWVSLIKPYIEIVSSVPG